MTKFKVLGALEVHWGSQVWTPTIPKVRHVLALLVLRANQVVHLDQLVEELWDETPPKSAVPTAQTYIYQLRKAVVQEGLDRPDGGFLVTKPSGYVLQTKADQVDAAMFERLVGEGRHHLKEGRADEATQVLRQALNLWHGRPIADISPGRVLTGHVVLLEELRLRAFELRIQADLQLGRHRELIGELKSLVAAYPLHEWFHSQLIAVLGHVGRRSEALQAYQRLRRLLNDELGLEPASDVQRLQQELLSDGYATARMPALA